MLFGWTSVFIICLWLSAIYCPNCARAADVTCDGFDAMNFPDAIFRIRSPIFSSGPILTKDLIVRFDNISARVLYNFLWSGNTRLTQVSLCMGDKLMISNNIGRHDGDFQLELDFPFNQYQESNVNTIIAADKREIFVVQESLK